MGDTKMNGGRAQAYQALRESEELHRATLGSISDAVFLTDDQGTFTYVCPNVDVIFGYSPDEVHEMERIVRLLGADLFDPAALAAQGEIRNLEREVTSKSGKRRHVLVHVKAVSIKQGTVLYVCRDVTERKQAEEALRTVRSDLAHAYRLTLIGELMASIAHEVNQPLTSIISNAGAGLRLLTDGAPERSAPELRDILEDVRAQGCDAAKVIERLRALARKRPLEFRPLDVNEIVNDMLRLTEGDIRRRGVAVHAELAAPLPSVLGDRVCLQQVVLNLIMNAMDAMERTASEERRLSVRTRLRDDFVEVAVSDSGHGIPAAGLPKLFDAFFTTKEEGIGLGLAIARSIVEAHDGRIWAEDQGVHGATFYFTLPSRQ